MYLFRAEWLKYRRTLTPWFVVGGPLLMVIAEVLFNLVSPYGRTWHTVLLTVFNWWVTLGIPFGIALVCALSAFYERRSGAWKILCSYDVKPGKLYVAKFVVLAVQVLIANILFALFVLLSQVWRLTGPIPWSRLAMGTWVAWLGAWALLALLLWFATRFGFGLTIAFGLAGLFCGILIADRHGYWVASPWSWPIRGMEPIFGFHANGLPLEQESPLWNANGISEAILLSFVGATVFLVLGAFWFNRREERS